MNTIVKRLELIKAAIALQDAEIVAMQARQLQALAPASAVVVIVQQLQALDYASALEAINQYLAKHTQLQSYEAVEVAALKLELQGLEQQLAQLNAQYEDGQALCANFERQYSEHLGEVIGAILQLREQIAGVHWQRFATQRAAKKREYEAAQQAAARAEALAAAAEEALAAVKARYAEDSEPYQAAEELLQRAEKKSQAAKERLQEKEAAYRAVEAEAATAAHEQEYEEAQADHAHFSDEFAEILAKPEVKALDKAQEKRLKIAFRRASQLCHPDMVVEELKAQATEQFIGLRAAYEQKDLAKVEQILAALQSGGFVAVSAGVDDRQLLRAQIQTLRERIEALQAEISNLENDDLYQLINELSGDYEAYFAEKLALLQQELAQLQEVWQQLQAEESASPASATFFASDDTAQAQQSLAQLQDEWAQMQMTPEDFPDSDFYEAEASTADSDNKQMALQLLRADVGNEMARFRDGQWQAIAALFEKRQKLLVVQRTGWGKSAVYFITARLFREQGAGPTVIISPLLALMRNQVAAAARFGLRAAMINSTNYNSWEEITTQLLANQIDCLFITPERLANERFMTTVLNRITDRVALMVIDEAHCISDWGHDFRLDYQRIVNVLKNFPDNTPVLGTTATANNRVTNDIKQQIGDVYIQRGTLKRASLALSTMTLGEQSSRLAWLVMYLSEVKGTGIIYTQTTRDADRVAQWLRQNNISAKSYHSDVQMAGFDNSNAYREHLEDLLLNNEIKALVATTALGMGYDKPDLRFVIHFQTPGSIIGYYQQVGRAGRKIDHAEGILLYGKEDADIQAYFRHSAFPSSHEVNEVLAVLENSDGLSIINIESQVNMRRGQIDKVLKLLAVESPSPVIKKGSQWLRTAVHYELDTQRIERLTNMREQEWQEMMNYIETSQCKMQFLQEALDDDNAQPCGKCSSCLGEAALMPTINEDLINQASIFLKNAYIPIKIKKQVAANAFLEYGFRGNLPIELQAQEGRVLSRWGDAGWGKIVERNKHHNHFSDNLVDAMVEMIQHWQPNPFPQWVCCVPSNRHVDLVPNFARRVAEKLGLPFYEAIVKQKNNEPQKQQENRFHQCKNLDGVFSIVDYVDTPVLLIDDAVDSGWTLAVLAALLQQAGSGVVYPVALATTSVRNI